MIIFCAENVFRKNDKKWLKVSDYLIIDGDDAGNYGRKTDSTIADDYNNVVTMGALSPSAKLIRVVNNNDDEDEFSPNKIDDMIDNYITDKSFVAALVAIVKGFIYEGDTAPGARNVFVVLPKKVYKAFSDIIMKKMKRIFSDADFKFVIDQDDVAKDKTLLSDKLGSKKIKVLTTQVKWAEKHFKINK